MSDLPAVLFVCTGNACRSQMAEALLRHLAGDRFEVLSAGSRPAGFVHPLALDALASMDVPTDDLKSKHWSEFAERELAICITVCDNASAECPTWPGDTAQVHWGLPDPAYFNAEEPARLEFATRVAETLRNRLSELSRLQMDRLTRDQLVVRLEAIATRHPAPTPPPATSPPAN